MASFTDMVLDGSDIRREGNELLIPIRVPWYRSMALSTFEHIAVSINGQAIPSGRITFELNNKHRKLEELADLWQENWFIQDAAILRVSGDSLPETGDSAVLEVTVDMRAPYILVGPGIPLRRHVVSTEKIEVK